MIDVTSSWLLATCIWRDSANYLNLIYFSKRVSQLPATNCQQQSLQNKILNVIEPII